MLCSIKAIPVLQKSTSCLGLAGDSREAPIYFLKEISPVKIPGRGAEPYVVPHRHLGAALFYINPYPLWLSNTVQDFLLPAVPPSRAPKCGSCNQSISHAQGTGTGNPCASLSISGSVGSSAAARVRLESVERQISLGWQVGPSLP